MGVGGPSNFVTIVNRFPPHDQSLTTHLNARFVTISATNLVGAFHHPAPLFRLQAVQRTNKLRGIRSLKKLGLQDFLHGVESRTGPPKIGRI
jgi:hypothetical protein